MVKRKWLWKRSSLDKSAGESETSGSMSSQSEKCSEEQECTKGSPNHNTRSPEVTSNASGDECNKENQFASKNSLLKKLAEADQEDLLENNLTVEATLDGPSIQGGETDEATPTAASNGEEENESVKLLKENLSAALINVSLKDELVKQHTKVAEEAVAGWEKAENEGASLKQQLDTAVQQNSTLEARLIHLDQALKECVRQLRLAKDEQERKISEALAEKSNEFELSKSNLESQIIELQAQLEDFSANSPVPADPEIHLRLEFLERENQSLKHELIAQSEELEIRTIERDLSTKAAETASKQHLESIRMVAKLESECRKLKARSRKSPSTTSYSIDSVTNSQSDGCEALSASEVDLKKMNGFEPSECALSDSWAAALIAELDQFKNEKSHGKSLPSSTAKIDLMDDFLEMEKLAAMPENGHHPSTNVESLLREELKVITSRAAELEEKVWKMEAEKVELETVSSQNQMSLENLQVDLIEAKMKLEQLEAELQEANELKMDYESYANDLKLESQAMMSKIEQLQAEVDRQRISTEKLSSRCQELENDLCIKSEELEVQRDAACSGELEEKKKRLDELETEIKEAMWKLENQEAASRSELDEKEMTLAESRKCLEELQMKLEEAEMKLDTQNAVYNSEVREKVSALAKSQERLDELQIQLKEAENKLEMLQKELHDENKSKEHLLSELNNARGEVETMSAQIDTLQTQIGKEHGISTEHSAKCEELEKELKQREHELQLRQNVPALVEQKINQEDLTNAAGKLAECQKTIASLGNQLKSLATLEDFLIDTASIPAFSGSAPLIPNGGSELWKLHSNNVYLPQKRRDAHFQDPEEGLHTFSKYVDGDVIESSSSSSANLLNCSSSEKRGNGFEKLFPMRRG